MNSKLFLLSLALWAVPFLLRLSVHIEPVANDKINTNTNSVVERIVESIDDNDGRWKDSLAVNIPFLITCFWGNEAM